MTSQRLVVCVDCKTIEPHHAKGRCVRCYARSRIRIVVCVDCGRSGPEHRAGRCARCYRLARAIETSCLDCGQQRRCWAGICQRCQRRRAASAGACTSCGRAVSRLWSGQRCASCAHAGWSVGSCSDCYAWTISLAGQPARCRACRDFSRRNPHGQCGSCYRRLAVNRQRRCRLCLSARRNAPPDDHHNGDQASEPAQVGIQLFLGDLESGRRPRPAAAAAADVLLPGEIDGQLELLELVPDPRRTEQADQGWAGTPAGQTVLAELASFAAARGWRPQTMRAVAVAVALVGSIQPPVDLSAEMVAELRRRRLPVSRLREFRAQHAGQPTPVTNGSRVLGDLPGNLPAAMTRELTVWLEVLSGACGRARPHAASTVAAYRRAVVPLAADWAGQYPSLREVTRDDVAAQLEPLTGSARTGTAVALRSLFATLKHQRMIFTDPARQLRPGRFPRRPVLGLDDVTRADLLTSTTRADHRLVLLLAGVHALTRADITALRLDQVELCSRRLVLIHDRPVTLDELTFQHLLNWLKERRTRWPATANPHLLLTAKSAYGLAPVSTRYFRGLPITLSQLRADRLLAAAADSHGDSLTLVQLFGVSDDTAMRYCSEVDQPHDTGT